MRIYRISAVTLKVTDMGSSRKFYSKLPGFKLVYGGGPTDSFTTFEIGEGSRMYLNLEFVNDDDSSLSDEVTRSSIENYHGGMKGKRGDFGRIVFHTEDIDSLYQYMKNDKTISEVVTFENEPVDAPWGERYFHVREPNGYQLSFAHPLSREEKYYCE